jgi:plasmid stabilization system protein ParE
MRVIVFSTQARKDLADAWDYIAAHNINAADRLVDRVEADVRKLADMPGMGHRRRDVNDVRLLFWAVHPYLIVYRFTRRTVYILRVVHGARDLRKIFRTR